LCLSSFSEKEREHAELEDETSDANKHYQKAETTLSSLNAQAKAKREELKGPFLLFLHSTEELIVSLL